ncbi:MAG: hypothetical protein JWO38_701 [Gemmataceae bacterium]|nr:hypothetical protein [Gemmataceae bacterium]
MTRLNRRMLLGLGVVTAAGLVPVGLRAGDQPKAIPAAPGQPLNIVVTTAAPAPDVSLVLGSRSSKVTPCRSGCNHTGGGNIDVQQPSPDTLVVTMSGAAVAYGGPTGPATASLIFDLCQQFEVSFDKPTVKAAKLTLEGRVIGFLRSHKVGTADEVAGATVTGGAGPGLTLAMPSHAVAGCESISINDKEGPVGVVVAAGKYTLNQSFKVSASMPKSLLACKGPSSEFAPDPAIDPLWLSAKEPFHGAAKKDLGFQVTVKVAPEDLPEPAKK